VILPAIAHPDQRHSSLLKALEALGPRERPLDAVPVIHEPRTHRSRRLGRPFDLLLRDGEAPAIDAGGTGASLLLWAATWKAARVDRSSSPLGLSLG
jgi:hypothetical protein